MQFLALLDYVSRAHEIKICPSSVVRRPLSVIRVAIISEPTCIEQIPFKFQLWLPLVAQWLPQLWPYPPWEPKLQNAAPSSNFL